MPPSSHGLPLKAVITPRNTPTYNNYGLLVAASLYLILLWHDGPESDSSPLSMAHRLHCITPSNVFVCSSLAIVILQVKSRTSASCAAKPSASRPIWSPTCASTPATSRSPADSVTRPSSARSICGGTATASTRPWPTCRSRHPSHSKRSGPSTAAVLSSENGNLKKRHHHWIQKI